MPTEADLLARLREKNRIIAEQQAALDAYKRQFGPLRSEVHETTEVDKLITKPFPAYGRPRQINDTDDLS